MKVLCLQAKSVLPAVAITALCATTAIAQNIAAGKPGTGTFFDRRFPVSSVTDGFVTDTPHLNSGANELDNYWLAPSGATGAGASFTLDLLGTFDVSQITLTNTRNFQHNGAGDSGTNAFSISTSADNVTFTPLLNNNLPAANSPTIFGGLDETARYVRFQADSFHGVRAGLAEIEIAGTSNTDVGSRLNVVDGKTITGTALDSRFPASNVSDGQIQDQRHTGGTGDLDTYWLAPNGDSGVGTGFDIDLGDSFLIEEFVLVNTLNRAHNAGGDSGTEDFQILLSDDGINFTSVVDDTLPFLDAANESQSMPFSFAIAPTPASFIRFQADSFFNQRAGLNEFAAIAVITPEPSSIAIWTLLSAVGAFWYWCRRSAAQSPTSRGNNSMTVY